MSAAEIRKLDWSLEKSAGSIGSEHFWHSAIGVSQNKEIKINKLLVLNLPSQIFLQPQWLFPTPVVNSRSIWLAGDPPPKAHVVNQLRIANCRKQGVGDGRGFGKALTVTSAATRCRSQSLAHPILRWLAAKCR
jgi:hypothetical protein